MDAELIAVGSELLRFGRADTNGDWLSERLQRLGIEVVSRTSVGDELPRLVSQIRAALTRSDVVLLTGGLGPTVDDRTREALAEALDAPLVTDPDREEALRAWYEARGLELGPGRIRMAQRPRGMRPLDNPVGSAPGLAVERGRASLYALPGVPGEMQAIFAGSVENELRRAAATGALAYRTLKVAGRTESAVDDLLSDLYESRPGVEVTILTAAEGIELRLRAQGASRADAIAQLTAVERPMCQRLGLDLYGTDDDTLPVTVGRALERARSTVATAESCTAGLIAAALTEPAGSSAWFRGGLVVYDNLLKVRLAGVREDSLTEYGAVSEAVARELARGARSCTGADFGIGVTGIAGPGGATPDKPVGRVHLAWSHATRGWHRQLDLVGSRALIRRRIVAAALDGLRRELIATDWAVDEGSA